MTIKTHISVTDSTIKDRGMGFKLSPLNTGTATLSLLRTMQASTGNVRLLGNGDNITINVSPNSTSLDTVSKFAECLSVVVTD